MLRHRSLWGPGSADKEQLRRLQLLLQETLRENLKLQQQQQEQQQQQQQEQPQQI